jgi:hypothetical protein
MRASPVLGSKLRVCYLIPGFTVKLLLNSGAYGYRAGALNDTNILGRQSSITAMPGWRFKRANYEVTVFAG